MEKETLDWDFKGENTKEYTHGFHTYPAMMIPQIARKLIGLYGKDAKILLDPFMGSGTALVEASLTNHLDRAYGFDLNPLAVLIAKVKTTPLEIETLNTKLKEILSSKEQGEIPKFKNIEFWFKPEIIKKLAMLKTAIDKIEDKNIRDFFQIVFSETVRRTSNTRNTEFKLYRMREEKLEKYDPDVFAEFQKIALKNIKGMEEYIQAMTGTFTKPSFGDTKSKLPIKTESVDIIVTSPPYGDSRTTVAYGQFSRLALQWLGFEDINNLDRKLLGGIAAEDLKVRINSPTLKETIKQIAEKDAKRAREVLGFYEDFDKCVSELNRVMAIGGHICFVVGNRTVKGIQIPTDKIMIEMFKAKGKYEYITTYYRNIPNKRMPHSTSPTNKVGELSPTMSKESIFILKRL